MKKYYIIFFTGFLFFAKAKAQSTVHVYDLNPGTYTDSLLDNSNMIRLNVNYKIQNVDQADSVYFMMGSTVSASDVGIVTGKMILTSDGYAVTIGTDQYPVTNLETTNSLTLAIAQFKLSKYISVKVKDVTGSLSNTISIRIN